MYSVIQQFSKQGFSLTKGKLHKSIQPIQPSKKKKGGKKREKKWRQICLEISYLDMLKVKTVKHIDMTFDNVLSLVCQGF